MASCELPHICEQLQCSICLDVLTDPVTTPCGHNFCDTCLKICWDNCQDYRCPYCKETFIQRPDLKFNVGLKAIMFKENPKGLSTAGELLSDELQCCICLDVFDNPVTTPCGHNFCDTCLKICWDNSQECTCPMCRETFNQRPDLKFNTGLKAIVEIFEKNSGYKREKIMMEYSLPLEREDQEETLVKPSVMASSSDILTQELQCSVCLDLFSNPPTARACEHNFFKTCLLEVSWDYDCLCCKENSGMLDLEESSFGLILKSVGVRALRLNINIKQVIMIELSENTNLSICKKHETILEMFYRGRADNTYEKHERNSELFSRDCQASVYLFCRTHNTLPVDSAEMKGVEEKMAAPPTGRKGRRKSIDIPPFMASCELPHICEQLQCSICLDMRTDPVTTPCGHNFCDTCLKKFTCTVCKEACNKRPDLKFNTGLKEIVQVFEKTSVYEQETVMEYSPPLERED